MEMPSLSAIVESFITEAGDLAWKCNCSEDKRMVQSFVFVNEDHALIMQDRWQRGDASLRHIAIKNLAKNS